MHYQSVLCNPGTFHNETSGRCEPCARGTYQRNMGRARCELCPKASTTLHLAATTVDECVVECRPGNYLDVSTGVCEQCGHMGYQPKAGSTSCYPCPHGTVSLTKNATSLGQCIYNCPPGQQHTSDGACEPCAVGFYKALNDVLCQPCPASTTTEDIGSTSATHCLLRMNF
ncbi:unnamed protein product [Anisakis simplex]|uniref:Ephrin_rec_like domain-containing protein n=1 Tax=Anisakis simplex TaxID=6269 RepID=A0A0M3KGQ6_ANISI|nr:unnamed protein product [Anisakis simplex]